MTKFTTSLQNFESKLWGHHFPIPEDIAKTFIEGQNRRVICHIGNQYKMQCALMPYSDGYFILINKDLVKRLGLSMQVDISLTLAKDRSEYGHEMPESFQMLLDQDDAGRAYFDRLTPGKKRSLIYIVRKVKNVDSQLNKGLAVLDHLRAEKGELDFKKLNERIKEYNQRSKLKN